MPVIPVVTIERAADAAIRLQDAQKIPDLTLGTGINQIPAGGSTYNVGVGITLPVHDRNQGERAKALIEKRKAQNQQQLITNQVTSDVDKALVAFATANKSPKSLSELLQAAEAFGAKVKPLGQAIQTLVAAR